MVEEILEWCPVCRCWVTEEEIARKDPVVVCDYCVEEYEQQLRDGHPDNYYETPR